MAKLFRGRLSGVDGMEERTAEELYAWADELEAQINDPSNQDDPRYLTRWVEKMRTLARQKEKALEHKMRQRNR
jgi:hypothetical protein